MPPFAATFKSELLGVLSSISILLKVLSGKINLGYQLRKKNHIFNSYCIVALGNKAFKNY